MVIVIRNLLWINGLIKLILTIRPKHATIDYRENTKHLCKYFEAYSN